MDEITQQQIDRLKRIDAGNRARVKKFKDKALAAGFKQITAMVDGVTYDELCRRRDRSVRDGEPLSFADVIKQALFQGRQDNVTANDTSNIKVEPKEPEYSLFDCLEPKAKCAPSAHLPDSKSPHCGDLPDHEKKLLAIDAAGGTWAEKAERANAEGLLTKRGKLYKTSNIRMEVASIKAGK